MGVQYLDADARVFWANRAQLELLGYCLEQYVGRPVADFHADAEAGRQMLAALRRGEALRERPEVLRHRDGSVRHVLISTVCRAEHGRLASACCFVQDVTERLRVERQLAAENGVARALAEATSLRDAAPRVLEAVCRTTDWSWGALWVVERDGGGSDGEAEPYLSCAEFWRRPDRPAPGFEATTRGLRFRRGEGLPGQVWAGGQPAWVEDIAARADVPPPARGPGGGKRPGAGAGAGAGEGTAAAAAAAAADEGVHGALAFPVPAQDGGVLGVMEFFSRHPRQPEPDLLDMMRAVGTQVGRYMERRRSEQALAGSQARNAAVIHASLDAVISIDHCGRVLEWNPAAEFTFGYTRDEVIGRDMAELIVPPRLRDPYRQALSSHTAPGPSRMLSHRVETFAVRRGGVEEFPVELAVVRVPGPGPPSFTGFVRDLSERRRADDTSASLRAVLQELLVARDIQEGVLPKRVPRLPGIQLAGMVRAAAQCSGDFYDFLTAADGGALIALGDASGHGLGPALVAVETATCLRTLAHTFSRVDHLLTEANAILADGTPVAAFITMILVGIDAEARRLTYANAGHPAGLVVDRDGRLKAELASSELPLAVTPNVVFQQGGPLSLDPGDLVVLVSDGLLEAWSPEGVAFGRARLYEAICAVRHESAAAVVEHLYDTVRSFTRWVPQHDDMTSVVLKVAGE
jgi:PAS domain S-box-containing protein